MNGMWKRGKLDCMNQPGVPDPTCDDLPMADTAWMQTTPSGNSMTVLARRSADIVSVLGTTTGITISRLDPTSGASVETLGSIAGPAVATNMLPIPSGGWVMSGWLGGDLTQGNFTLSGAPSSHFALVMNETFDAQWGSRFGDGDAFFWRAYASGASDGAISATGGMAASTDFGGFSLSQIGHDDVAVGQLAAPGQATWAHAFGSSDNNDAPAGIHRTAPGDTILATRAYGDIDLGGGLLTVQNHGLGLSRYDAAGQHVWSLACSGDHVVHHAVWDDADNAYILVTAQAVVDCGVPLPVAHDDAALIKVAADGTHQWTQPVVGNGGSSIMGKLAWHPFHGLAVTTADWDAKGYYISVERVDSATGASTGASRIYYLREGSLDLDSAAIADDGLVVISGRSGLNRLCHGGQGTDEHSAFVAGFPL